MSTASATVTSVETPFALHSATTTLGVVEWNGSVPLVEDVSITEFVDAVEVLLRSNATLDDALLADLFVAVGKLASSVEATEADILVETAESLAYLSFTCTGTRWCAKRCNAWGSSDGSRSADGRQSRCRVCFGTISCASSSYCAWHGSGDRFGQPTRILEMCPTAW